MLTGVCAADVASSIPDVAENQNRIAAGRIDHGTLTLHIELRRGVWHPETPDGRAIEAPVFAEEGRAPQAPGPLIRVPQGTELHASIHNLLDATVYLHGLHEHPGKTEDFIEFAPSKLTPREIRSTGTPTSVNRKP